MEISNIRLTHKDGNSIVLANVKNTTDQDVTLIPIILTLLDDKGNVLEKINGLISPVKASESIQLNVAISGDYANAYDFTVEKK